MRFIVTAGGTGGHIMPAVAVAQALRERCPGSSILFVGTTGALEAHIAAKTGLEFRGIPALGIKGKSALTLLRGVAVNTASFVRALSIVRSFRPNWVLGTGGYVTGMVVLAGKVMGCRVAIQEQNSVPGLTNRLLAPLVDRVYLSFPDAMKRFPENKTRLVGNPLRREVTAVVRSSHPTSVLVLGGSLGASSINRAFVGALELLKNEGVQMSIIHQCGQKDFPWVSEAYGRMGVKAQVYPFIDDMGKAYADAVLAVSRCGGITLAELSYLGIPAIMIPFPHAADDHQRLNGAYVAQQGGGWLIDDKYLDAERLAAELKARLADPQLLRCASKKMKALGLGGDARAIAQEMTDV